MDVLNQIKAIVTDVDGVMTNGGIIVGAGETKVFSVRDGLAISLLRKTGHAFAILSGRKSAPVEARAAELGISVVMTGRLDKETAFREIVDQLGIPPEAIAFIGDDLPDLAPMRLAALACCPRDAVAEVRAAADLIVPVDGGQGVVRHVIELVLKAQGHWDQLVRAFEGGHD